MKQTSDPGGTKLATAVEPHVAAHPGQSGLHALADGRDALAARLVLADAAE
jgi:putative cardiolipin synthase